MSQHKQFSVYTHLYVHKISIWLSLLPLPHIQIVTVYIEINKKVRDINYHVIQRDES